jgi:hypothetical protein
LQPEIGFDDFSGAQEPQNRGVALGDAALALTERLASLCP